MQWIANGYAAAAFDLPLASYLDKWGAVHLAGIFRQIETLYRQTAAVRNWTFENWEQFAGLYHAPEALALNGLQTAFLDNCAGGAEAVADYVQANFGRFAEMV